MARCLVTRAEFAHARNHPVGIEGKRLTYQRVGKTRDNQTIVLGFILLRPGRIVHFDFSAATWSQKLQITGN